MEVGLAVFIAVTLVLFTSLAGQYFTSRSVNSAWYECIKPSLTPPSVVFPIVWTVLYIMIAIAFSRALIADDYVSSMLLVVNLMLNVVWCYLFFATRRPLWALPAIAMIWISIVILLWIRQNDNIFAILLIPYLLWITFATVLNVQASLNSDKNCEK